ncbi:MAG: 4'-phosphopantetheinyl transferase superfamily protein [Pseudomonadota bacterium]
MTVDLFVKPEIFSPALGLNHSCHLWLLDLTQLTDEAILLQQTVLSSAELLRAQTFKQRQLQFIAMRAFVRLCLSRYTLSAPHTLTLTTEANGKPYLTNAPLPIVFNLSHSHNMAILAVGMDHAVGVDIEITTRRRSQHSIAERYFHPTETATFKQLADTEQCKYFFQLWTLKEAFLKATGAGISGGLDKTAFNFHDEDIRSSHIQVAIAPELKTRAEAWQFYQTFITADYCVALARNSEQPFSVRWFNGAELFF